MAKLVVVIGATGNQGGSVVRALKETGGYRVRGITTDLLSEKSIILTLSGVEMVAADLNDQQSLLKVFEGASVIFGVTDYGRQLLKYGPAQAQEKEYQQAVNLANAAAATPTLEHYIWSTIPSASTVSQGRHKVPHFESKAYADEYIHKHLPELARKTTFLWVGYFASNVRAPPMAPTLHATSKKQVWLSPVGADTRITSVGLQTHNVGVFVAAILAQPSLTLPAKYVLAEVESTTIGEIVTKYGDVNGEPTELINIGPQAFDRLFPGWDAITKMFLFWQAAGSYSFTKPGVSPLTREDLDIDRDKLKNTEEAFKIMKSMGM